MSRGIGSLDKGMQVLRVLGEADGPLALNEIAARARLSAAMAHRYLASLVDAGMVARTGGAGQYALGAQALRLGMRAMLGIDGLEAARAAIARWNAQTGEAVMLAVWMDDAPVIIDWHASHRAVSVYVRVGARLDPTRSATGRAFLAFGSLGALVTARASRPGATARAEARALTWEGRPVHTGEIDRLLDGIRRRGLARSLGDLLPGIDAIAVPVLDAQRHARYVITTLGPHGSLDARLDGGLAASLRACAGALATQLGQAA